MAKLGRYELVKRLAQGGMAELFLARQSGPAGFEKMLVVKRLLPSLSSHDDIVRMFLNEARIAARLTHPNIVQIYDLGKSGGEYFIAMEYVPSKDLRAVQKAAVRAKRRMPYELSAYILSCVCRGLHHAHQLRDNNGRPLGLVHRDVTPHNVLLSFAGDVKLADFGIAKATALAAETQAGVLKGKFAYMSPEQIRGEELDARTDIFSAGVLLYELICWRRLFRRSTDFATIQAVERIPIPPPSAIRDDVPDAMETIVMRALNRDRSQRYATAEQMQLDLDGAISEHGWRCGPLEMARFVNELFGEKDGGETRAAPKAAPAAKPSTLPKVKPAPPLPKAKTPEPPKSAPLAQKITLSGAVTARVRQEQALQQRTDEVPASAEPQPQPAQPAQPTAAPAKAPAYLDPTANFAPTAEDGAPTIVQPPDFDDIIFDDDDENEPDLAELPPVKGHMISEPEPGVSDETPTVIVEGEPAAVPDYGPSAYPMGEREMQPQLFEGPSGRLQQFLLIVGIVISLSLAVTILLLIVLRG